MTTAKCERCGRMRSVKYLERAVYVRDDISGGTTILAQANAFRCAAKATCKGIAKQKGEMR